MKYYTAVKKDCSRHTFVGEDLQDMLLTGWGGKHVEKSRSIHIVAGVRFSHINAF